MDQIVILVATTPGKQVQVDPGGERPIVKRVPIMREPTIPKSTMRKTKARCETCNGGFGLVRHRYASKQFCSKQCLDSYLAKTKQQASSFKQ
jgi:hypothetical protein